MHKPCIIWGDPKRNSKSCLVTYLLGCPSLWDFNIFEALVSLSSRVWNNELVVVHALAFDNGSVLEKGTIVLFSILEKISQVIDIFYIFY